MAVVEIVVGPSCQCFARGVWVRNTECYLPDFLGVYECHDDDCLAICINTSNYTFVATYQLIPYAVMKEFVGNSE